MSDLITMTITDDQDAVTFGLLEVPLVQKVLDGRKNVETLDGNIFSYVHYTGKKEISHNWAYLTAQEYERLKGFERRQYTTMKRPLLTIAKLNIQAMPVVMELSEQNIINSCGMVSDVTATFRETVQNSIGVA